MKDTGNATIHERSGKAPDLATLAFEIEQNKGNPLYDCENIYLERKKVKTLNWNRLEECISTSSLSLSFARPSTLDVRLALFWDEDGFL